MRKQFEAICLLTLVLALTLQEGQAATVTWLPPGPSTNDWFTGANWSGGLVPTNNDEVVITNAGIGVLLTNSTYSLSSLFISNTATLICSNWNTALNATTVTVQKSAIITHAANSDTNGADGWTPDARVWIVCSNLTVAASGSINVNLKGYGARLSAGAGYGPGGGDTNTFLSSGYWFWGQGAGYGGFGAGGGSASATIGAYGALTYGTLAAPEDPGSGGGSGGPHGSYSGVGSWGGGAIRVDASGQVSINGTLAANGGTVYTNWSAGAGSGGAIFITCNTLAGNNGVLQAVGGIGFDTSYIGSGGGGRIAVLYNSSAQASLPIPTLQFNVAPGYTGTATARLADIGTVYFTNTVLLSNVLTGVYGQLRGFPAWEVDRLTVTSSIVRFAEEGFALTVTQDLVIATNARLQVGGSVYVYAWTNLYTSSYNHYWLTLPTPCNTGLISSVNVGGNLRLTNNAQLTLYNAITGATTESYGNLLTITGQLWVASNSWIYPVSHPTNGGSAFMVLGSLRTDSGGGIDANGRGFVKRNGNNYGIGPGGGLALIATNCGGGGYGGAGGGWTNAGGITYGSSNAPIEPGSSGANSGNGISGFGGGLVRIQVNNSAQHDGTIRANAGSATDHAGGAGGGIYLRCRSLSGAGTFQANGSAGVTYAYAHGGGGGRIALWRIYHTFTGTNVTVTGGAAGGASGQSGANGTIFWGQIPSPGTIFTWK
ncbi:MAG: hypothetical protein HYV35_11110 [Lentisphaerae bacterium]|nr:hypothetical protein [Lentisphaerota bacterium]